MYLALPPLLCDYHYQEQEAQSFIRNKPVNKLIFWCRSMGKKLDLLSFQLACHPFSIRGVTRHSDTPASFLEGV